MTDTIPKRHSTPGRVPVFVLAWLLLAFQLWLVITYFARQSWITRQAFCAHDDLHFCFLPLWSPAVAAAITVAAVLYSSIRFTTLPRTWWYIALPLTSIIASVFVRMFVPMVFE